MSKALNIRGDYAEAFQTFAEKAWPLGTRMHLADGRVFRFARAGAAALVVARVLQAARQDEMLRDAPAKLPRTGPRALSLEMGVERGITANTYEDGLLYANDGTGEGHSYHVAGSTLLELGSGLTALTVFLDSDYATLPDSTTRFTLLKNRYNSLARADNPPRSAVVGATPVAVAANYYFWLQTGGPCAALQEGDLEVYLPVQASRVTAGAVELATVVVPATAGERHGAEGIVVEPVLGDDGGPVKGRLAWRSGVGAVPGIPIGYSLSPAEHGQHCLISLTLEN